MPAAANRANEASAKARFAGIEGSYGLLMAAFGSAGGGENLDLLGTADAGKVSCPIGKRFDFDQVSFASRLARSRRCFNVYAAAIGVNRDHFATLDKKRLTNDRGG